MAFTIKDYWAYTDDDSQNKELVMLIAKPDGGGGYNLINMTKEEFFKITGHPLAITTSSANDGFLTINGNELFHYIAGGVLLVEISQFGISADGNTPSVLIRDNGKIKLGGGSGSYGGEIEIIDPTGTGSTRLIRNAIDTSVYEIATIQDQITTSVEATEDDTTSLGNEYQQIVILDATAGDLTDYTLEMPPEPRDSTTVEVTVYGNITTLAITTDDTIDDPITSTSGDLTYGKWTWNAATDTWLKVNEVTPASGGNVHSITTVDVVNLGSINIPNDFQATVIIKGGSGTVFTVNFPTSPVEAQNIKLSTQVGVASFIIQVSGGATINGNPSGTVSIDDAWEWVYQSSSDTWWRVR